MALFGEKYGDTVRVLDIGFSRELCGGTHVTRTGDIGLFKILSEGGVAAGVRRIEAITGDNAVRWVQETNDTLVQAAGLLKTQPAELVDRIALMQTQFKTLERQLDQLKSKQAASAGNDLVVRGHCTRWRRQVAGRQPLGSRSKSLAWHGRPAERSA